MLEEIDTLWRTAPLRPEKPSPTDEVRAVMAVFDETLYTAVPHVYRRVDDALQGPAAGGRAPVVRPFVRVGSWVGGDRDGNPFVTASVTRKAAAIASEHVLLGLERTANRIGRGLTLDAATTPPSDALLAPVAAAEGAPTRTPPPRSPSARPNEPHRRILLLIARKIAATRARDADLALHATPRSCSPTCGSCRTRSSQARRPAPGVRAPAAAALAGGDLRLPPHRARGAPALGRAREGARRARCRRGRAPSSPRRCSTSFRAVAFLQKRYGPRAAGRYIVSFTQSAQTTSPTVHRLAAYARRPDGRRPGARRHPAVRDLRRPAGRAAHPRRDRRAPGVRRAAGGDRAPAGGHARLLGLVEGRRAGRREPRALRRAGRDRRVGAARTASS